MSNSEVPIKISIEIQGQKYGLIVTQDMRGLALSPEPALRAANDIATLVANTVYKHFAPEVKHD